MSAILYTGIESGRLPEKFSSLCTDESLSIRAPQPGTSTGRSGVTAMVATGESGRVHGALESPILNNGGAETIHDAPPEVFIV